MIWGCRVVSNKCERGIANCYSLKGLLEIMLVQPLNKRATLLAKLAYACLSSTVGFWFSV